MIMKRSLRKYKGKSFPEIFPGKIQENVNVEVLKKS